MPNVQVNATISARDAASKNIKTVNNALGTLGKTAKNIGSDFKKLTFGIAGIAAGVGAFTASAIKDAALDEQATARLNAALKARGLATKSVLAAVDKQIIAGQKLAFTDDEVRASVEASTRFTKRYSIAAKMQSIAMDLARTTGMSLEEATVAVGKAYQGSGAKLLTSLGITQKGIKGQEALNALLGKTKGSAAAYANTVAGSFASLSIGAQELKEQFGKAFLPAIAKLFKGLNPYVDRLSHLIDANIPKLQKWADIIVTKILDKLPSLFAEFEANVPKALISIEKFVDKIGSIGKGADDLLGPGGSITLLVSGIGAAFGGLKGVITANLVKGGLDPFTALIVGNIAGTAIPNALAEVFTKVVVTKAIAAFGTSIAGASAAGAAASAAGTAGAAAGGGGLLALLGAAALPVTIVALSAAAVAAIAAGSTGKTMAQLAAESGNAPRPGQTSTTYNGPAIGPGRRTMPFTPFANTTPTAPWAGPTSTTAYNIFIGTGKVDTVVSDSITRLKRQGRNP
jgi:hypothetical protein